MTETTTKESQALANVVTEALDDGKAVDIRALPVAAMTSITDYMVIATGRSGRQVKALTDRVREAMTARGLRPIGVEGEASSEWVLLDYGDVVVHILQAETRDFYQLEKLWEARPSTHAANQADAG